MENKKYVLMEVAEEHGCNLEDLKYDAIYCSLTDEICPMSEDKPCPHGKTIDEMAEAMAKGTHKGYELQEGYHFVVEDTTKDNILGLKALLGGGGK